ncbi:hypothetical protein GCM10018954_084970 [Kutzneria kofuensis]
MHHHAAQQRPDRHAGQRSRRHHAEHPARIVSGTRVNSWLSRIGLIMPKANDVTAMTASNTGTGGADAITSSLGAPANRNAVA